MRQRPHTALAFSSDVRARRLAIGALTVLVAATSLAVHADRALADGGTTSAFASPPMQFRPEYRFWNGGGSLTAPVYQTELNAMKQAGAGAVESNTYPSVLQLDAPEPGLARVERRNDGPVHLRGVDRIQQR
jgi:hypothetical protein